MHPMTAANLRSACGGESMAHIRYQIWGDKAEEEGFPDVARLFRAIARAETVHASNHFRELGIAVGDHLTPSMSVFGLSSTRANLDGAIMGEMFEIEEMYPVYLETAKFQEEKGAQTSFSYALSAEREHAKLFKRAKQSVDAGDDFALGPVHICPVCGWTHEGEAPEVCPICGVSRDRFEVFGEVATVT